MQRPDRAWLIPLLGIAIVVMVSWLGIFGPIRHDWTAVGNWLYDWQTLIGALIALAAALVAAFFAARPVWRQSQILSLQATVDLLEIVEREGEQVIQEQKRFPQFSVCSRI
jgi:hypothetical protein